MDFILAHLKEKKKTSYCYSGEKSFAHFVLPLIVSTDLASTWSLTASARLLYGPKIQGSHSLRCWCLAFPQPLAFGCPVVAGLHKCHRFLILRQTALRHLWADGKLARTSLKAALRRSQTLPEIQYRLLTPNPAGKLE